MIGVLETSFSNPVVELADDFQLLKLLPLRPEESNWSRLTLLAFVNWVSVSQVGLKGSTACIISVFVSHLDGLFLLFGTVPGSV